MGCKAVRMRRSAIRRPSFDCPSKMIHVVNRPSPYLTLLKPRSFPPNPWATTEETTGIQETIGQQGDRAIKAIFVDDSGMNVNQVAAFAHTERKTYIHPFHKTWEPCPLHRREKLAIEMSCIIQSDSHQSDLTTSCDSCINSDD